MNNDETMCSIIIDFQLPVSRPAEELHRLPASIASAVVCRWMEPAQLLGKTNSQDCTVGRRRGMPRRHRHRHHHPEVDESDYHTGAVTVCCCCVKSGS